MGWIKANLDDETHDKLRSIVEESDEPTHEVAAEMIAECVNND